MNEGTDRAARAWNGHASDATRRGTPRPSPVRPPPRDAAPDDRSSRAARTSPSSDGRRDRRRSPRPSTSSTPSARPDIARALSLAARRRRPGHRGHRRGHGPGLRALAARQPPRPARGLGLPGGHELGPVDPAPPPAQRPPPLRPGATPAVAIADPDVHAALGELDVKHRTVIVCRHLLGWSVADTAAALKVREGTVKSRLSRATRILQSRLHHLRDPEEHSVNDDRHLTGTCPSRPRASPSPPPTPPAPCAAAPAAAPAAAAPSLGAVAVVGVLATSVAVRDGGDDQQRRARRRRRRPRRRPSTGASSPRSGLGYGGSQVAAGRRRRLQPLHRPRAVPTGGPAAVRSTLYRSERRRRVVARSSLPVRRPPRRLAGAGDTLYASARRRRRRRDSCCPSSTRRRRRRWSVASTCRARSPTSRPGTRARSCSARPSVAAKDATHMVVGDHGQHEPRPHAVPARVQRRQATVGVGRRRGHGLRGRPRRLHGVHDRRATSRGPTPMRSTPRPPAPSRRRRSPAGHPRATRRHRPGRARGRPTPTTSSASPASSASTSVASPTSTPPTTAVTSSPSTLPQVPSPSPAGCTWSPRCRRPTGTALRGAGATSSPTTILRSADGLTWEPTRVARRLRRATPGLLDGRAALSHLGRRRHDLACSVQQAGRHAGRPSTWPMRSRGDGSSYAARPWPSARSALPPSSPGTERGRARRHVPPRAQRRRREPPGPRPRRRRARATGWSAGWSSRPTPSPCGSPTADRRRPDHPAHPDGARRHADLRSQPPTRSSDRPPNGTPGRCARGPVVSRVRP